MENKCNFQTVYEYVFYDDEKKLKMIKVTKCTNEAQISWFLVDIRVYFKFDGKIFPSGHYGVSMTRSEFKEIWDYMLQGAFYEIKRSGVHDLKEISFRPIGAKSFKLSVKKEKNDEKFVYIRTEEIEKIRAIMDLLLNSMNKSVPIFNKCEL